MLRVGFVLSLNDGWLGGVNYYRNLLTAISIYPESTIQPVIFIGTDIKLEDFPDVEIVRNRMFNRKSFLWFCWRATNSIFNKDVFLERMLVKNKINILSHYNLLGKSGVVKTIGWIPDFQHLHLPQLFNKKEIKRRNKEFNDVCTNCTKVIVSSHAALADLVSFSEKSNEKAEVLQFAIPPINHKYDALPNIKELERKFNFNGKYFLLPNQFWVHKNHRVVIEAVSILKSKGTDIQVLSTGNTNDPRNPNHFTTLVERIDFTGINDNFKILGIIQMKELYVLMKNAEAIINPSLFEGWSTTVEESKFLGKKVILSDIPVHREQRPLKGEFFQAHDADLLAEKLESIWKNQATHSNQQLIENNLNNHIDPIQVFAKQYQSIILNLEASKNEN